ncbi:DUF6301 family protein [Nocardia sp. CC227C]|uniref:DUF6301 family protein n=1 Tax=Nocardia sp. CC227C TaxID=3044562 RepID=UPI00278BC2F0|nr:DUF6301 family protein [Nocardia sp. CC227C]
MREWRALTDSEFVELATRLRSLDWSWNLDDAPPLIADFGWTINNTLSQLVKFDTGFGRSTGGVSSLGGRAADISVQVTTYAGRDAEGRARVLDTFAGYTAALIGAIGEPTARLPGEYPEIRWAGAQTTLRLQALSSSVTLHLMTNEGLARHDRIVRLQEQGMM